MQIVNTPKSSHTLNYSASLRLSWVWLKANSGRHRCGENWRVTILGGASLSNYVSHNLLPAWFSFLRNPVLGFVGQHLQRGGYVFMLLHLENIFVVSVGPFKACSFSTAMWRVIEPSFSGVHWRLASTMWELSSHEKAARIDLNPSGPEPGKQLLSVQPCADGGRGSRKTCLEAIQNPPRLHGWSHTDPRNYGASPVI